MTTCDTCPICAFDRPVKCWVTCPKCSFYCCKGCTKKYLLEQPAMEPKCMSCKAQWDYEFIAENTDEGFHNKEYREHRARIMMSMERSLLPSTQPYVVIEKERRAKEKELADTINDYKKCRNFTATSGAKMSKYHKKLAKYRQRPNSEQKIAKYKRRIKLLRKQRSECRELTAELLEQKLKLQDQMAEPSSEVKEEKSIRFIGHCPQDKCNGYLDTKYICGICGEKACRSCRQPKHNGQECDKNIVETIKLLATDTKACPNCGIPIYKISGCDQMFCTSCHTAFDWVSGQIVNGRIHNPHFYEWQREHGGAVREVGDVRCGGAVDIYSLEYRLKKCGFPKDIIERVRTIHMLSGHIRDIVLPDYQGVENENSNRDLRVKYLLGDFSEKEWISHIKRRQKQKEKAQAINMILTMFVDTIDDLTGNIVTCRPNEIDLFLVQLEELNKYTRASLAKIEKRFKNKVPSLQENWDFKDVGQRTRRRRNQDDG